MSRLKSIINRQYMLAIFAILVIDLIGFATHIYVTYKNEGYAELINISGRQRMLSQRITLQIHQLKDLTDNQSQFDLVISELANNIMLFEQSHNLLTAVDPSHQGDIDELILAYYEDSGLNQDVNVFLVQAKGFMEQISPSELTEFTTRVKGEFLSKLNEAVKRFETVSDDLTGMQLIIQIIVFSISIVTLAIIAFLILKPLRDAIIIHEGELADSIDRLEQEGTYKSMFLANMSHELRTPLNGILGVTALVKSKKVDDEMTEFMEIIDKSGNTLLGTIDNILDLTKLEMEQMQFENRSFNPFHLVDSVYQTFKYYPNSNPVVILSEFAEMPKYLLGDEQKIMQIINNLMSNAIKFTQKGKIILSASYTDGKFNVAVSDTGIGIPDEKQNVIFEPFKQADASTKREFGGTGLGLAISKQMASSMGGELSVRSVVDKGTTFSLVLPLDITDVVAMQTEENALDDYSLSGFTGMVLIAEDNMINYQVLSKMLDKLNIKYRHAVDGLQAVELVIQYDFDLILMDYHMPNMNGIEAIKSIQQLDKKNPPMVMLTADITDESKRDAFDVGVIDFLEKPINISRLTEVIKHCLSRAEKD